MFPSNILPHSLLSQGWWDPMDDPNLLRNQNFAIPIREGDLLPIMFIRGYPIRPRTKASIESSGQSLIKNDTECFVVILELKHFSPEEIQVKVKNNYVFIRGKHQEKNDGHGFVSREFERRYLLPHDVKSETLTCSFSPDGFLTIKAAKKVIRLLANDRDVPIEIRPLEPEAIVEKQEQAKAVVEEQKRAKVSFGVVEQLPEDIGVVDEKAEVIVSQEQAVAIGVIEELAEDTGVVEQAEDIVSQEPVKAIIVSQEKTEDIDVSQEQAEDIAVSQAQAEAIVVEELPQAVAVVPEVEEAIIAVQDTEDLPIQEKNGVV